MAEPAHGVDLIQVVILLGAGVVAAPLFRRLGLGSVLGYFAAGLMIGPFGLGLISDPLVILHTAEFGVIMLLFIIGLEMQPSRLWTLRREILGIGATQVALCGALLTGVGILAGLAPVPAFVAGMGFVLSSTAVVMQMLEERGEIATPEGQKAVSILLLEDLAIVPLLAVTALLAPAALEAGDRPHWQAVAIAAGAVVGLVAAGRWLLNPFFRVLAAAKAREVMTAAALLVVLGSALLMQVGGLSMAMGAFLAGVLLSESVFRHQLEADIEPFRGILLGLFFLAVGMSLDVPVIAEEWRLIAVAVVGYTLVKAAGIYGVARAFGANNREAVTRTTLFAQGGEFAFVLYSAAAAGGLFDARQTAIFTAVIIISMALTPLIALAARRLTPDAQPALDGVEAAESLQGRALVIGFGRFAQVASQSLLARGVDVSIIENDVDMIGSAADFGFKVYYGDGTRLDILHASGAARAEAILVCVDDAAAASRIVSLVKGEFPQAKLFVRAYDRGHAMELIRAGVDFQLRETFESALKFGGEALRGLGVDEAEVEEITAEVRRRDAERLCLQVVGDIRSGADLMHRNASLPAPVPTPLVRPRRRGPVFGDPAAGAGGSGDGAP